MTPLLPPPCSRGLAYLSKNIFKLQNSFIQNFYAVYLSPISSIFSLIFKKLFANLCIYVCLLLKAKEIPRLQYFKIRFSLVSLKNFELQIKLFDLKCEVFHISEILQENYSSCNMLKIFSKYLNFENVSKKMYSC